MSTDKMVISVCPASNIHRSRLEYVLHCLNHHPHLQDVANFQLDLDSADKYIMYGKTSTLPAASLGHLFLPAQNWLLAYEGNKEQVNLLHCNTYQIGEDPVYAVEKSPHTRLPFFQDGTFGFDIFETLFFHLTRYEEVVAGKQQKDKHGYMLEPHHFLVRHGLQRTPVVDILIDALGKTLGLSINVRGACIMSHDLDATRKYPNLRKLITASLKTFLPGESEASFSKVIRQYLAVKNKSMGDPYDTFAWLFFRTQHLEKYLFVLAGGKTRYEGHYHLASPELVHILAKARTANYTIGLHPSYASHNDMEKLRHEKEALENHLNIDVKHSRQHWLHFDLLETPILLEKIGIEFDHTMGYQNMGGFRSGTGYTYPWYSLKEERILKLWEKPFVLMDTALVAETKGHADHMREVVQDLHEHLMGKTDLIYNFHNSSFDPLRLGGNALTLLYRELVEDLGNC